MLKYLLFYIGLYVLGAITIVAADYIYRRVKVRRRAAFVTRRIGLLREFAEVKRIA